jgi:hypothetical protein
VPASRAFVLGGLLLAVFLVHAAYLAAVAEDAFITFRYAQNLVAGHGFVWNPGEPPVEGYTNFLWLLLSALWLSLGLDPVFWAQLAGVAASLVTLAYVWWCGVQLLGWSEGEALLPCLLLAVSGPFATWATGGLETALFGALLVAAVAHFASYWRGGGRRQLFGCSLALLLATLTRPEGMLVAAVLLGIALLASPGRGSESLRDFAAPVLLGLALFAVYVGWRWSTFGYLLPNTFYAKTGGSAAQYGRGARYLAFRGGRRAGAGRGAERLARRLREAPLLPSCAIVAAAYGVAVVWVGGDYMAMYRFLVPILPFAALLLAAAARRALASPRRGLALGSLAIGVLGTLLHSTPLEAALLPAPRGMHGNWRGVQTERWHVARLTLLGRFFAGHARGPGESLATDAIGAISYHSGLRVHGAHGLVDPELAHREGGDARIGRGFAGHERRDLAHLFSKRPTFFMLDRELRPRKINRLGLPGNFDASLTQEYRVVSVWLEDFENGEAGYFTFLERKDRGEAGESPPAARALDAPAP